MKTKKQHRLTCVREEIGSCWRARRGEEKKGRKKYTGTHFVSADKTREGKGEGPGPAEGGGNERGCPKRKPYPFKSEWDIAVREKERRGRRKRN
ncbi:hypothetical protein EYF80_025635 [Liparis tanakae]|uniref:Uncharacterized protein n=1 Tax=Liparis tanakae TaxID=230148 RepID=A0A4Z2HE41_9TELE|nr:hypothetical protein EYF80_025635 [Liparis tanakae]